MVPPARAVRCIAALVVVALALALAGAAQASSPPPPRLGEVNGVRLAVDASGRAVAAWAQAVDEVGRYRLRSAERGPAGWAPPRALTPAGESVSGIDLAGNAAGEAIVVWQRDPALGSPVRAMARAATAAWGDPVDLASPGSLAGGPRVAVGTDGTAVVVWGMSGGTLAAVVRRPGEAWGPMRIVSGPPAPGLEWAAPAVAPDGSALVTWVSGPPGQRAVQGAELAAGSAVLSDPLLLSAPGDVPWAPDAAMGPAGEAVVAWRHMSPDGATGEVVVAQRAAAGPWGAPMALAAPEAVTGLPPGTPGPGRGLRRPPEAVVDAAGRAVILWVDPVGAFGERTTNVRAAVRAPGGPWTVQTLAGPGFMGSPTLAAGPGGAVLALWRDRSRLLGALVGPGAAFAPPEDLTPSDDQSGWAEIGVDGSGGLVAVWRSALNEGVSVKTSARPAGGAWGATGEISRDALPTERSPKPGPVTPPTVRPEPTTGGEREPRRRAGRPRRVVLSSGQLRINQRIAQAALRRVRALEACVAGRAAPRRRPAALPEAVRLTRAQLVVNQRISQAALRRVAALEARLEGRRPPARRPQGAPGRIVLTAGQLLIDQRIAQAALRRVAALEAGLRPA